MSEFLKIGSALGVSFALAASGCAQEKTAEAIKQPEKNQPGCKVENVQLGVNQSKIIFSNANKYKLRNLIRIENLGSSSHLGANVPDEEPIQNIVEIREAVGKASEINTPPSGAIAGDYVFDFGKTKNESLMGGSYEVKVSPAVNSSKEAVNVKATICGTPDNLIESFENFDIPENDIEAPKLPIPEDSFESAAQA